MRKIYAVGLSIFLLFVYLSFAHGQHAEIRILHVNDFHGFVDPSQPLGSNESLGGIAFLSSKVNELRKEKPSILLSAGDMIQGNNWANLFQGKSVIELMNEMKFDAMVLGNHEFDFGQGALRKRISEAEFPILGANVKGLEGLKPYIIEELEGIRMGIIGAVTEDLPEITHSRNITGLQFLSAIDQIKKYIKELKNHVDLVVLLSHCGFHADRIFAESVEGIDVIVGGHSHTKIPKPVRVGNSIIVQAWEHGKALGVLDLTLKNRKMVRFQGHLEEIKPKKGREDKRITEIVRKYSEKFEAILNEEVGEAGVDLDGERGNVRRRETNLGNLIADILRDVSGAEGAVMNGGGIRASIKKGEIKGKDIYTVLPFDNYILAIKLTGKQISEALEHGVSAVELEEGRFPQISGLTFKYSPTDQKGSRIKEVLISGQPIDPNREYIVATNDFLAMGGDGYKVFDEAVRASRDFEMMEGMMKGEKILYSDSGRWLRDVVLEYIKGKKRVAPKVEGRIIEIR